jgi:drug/metabolite transporter (DMT)-like permease
LEANHHPCPNRAKIVFTQVGIPTWLVLALISPVFWAIVHVLDSHCVDEVFDAPWVGNVTSAFTMLAFMPVIGLGMIWADSNQISSMGVVQCCLAGIAYMASQVFYFKALKITESGIVAAYWNLLPFLLHVIGYLFLGEQLTGPMYLGSACLIIASILFCLVDGSIEYRWLSLGFMCVGACFQAVYFVLVDNLLETCSVYPVFIVSTISMIVCGLSPLLLGDCRRVFSSNWPRIWSSARFLLSIEIANMLAVSTGQYALKYGSASLVASVEATIPAYTMCLSLLLFAIFKRYGEEDASKRLVPKLALTGLMVLGVWLVS